ncbi:MAG: hypothetical protein JXR91_12885 [Deltaproteobacteria bacterium]|nr:hypothetical protein [Deltaproteobacteria bacterium]
MTLKSVEIENSFVSSIQNNEGTDTTPLQWSDIDPSGVIAPVGRMVSYKGSGLELALTGGIKISGLQLGFCTSWINAAFSGFSKRYMYIPELLRAGGTPFYDKSEVSIFRLMGSIKYGIPIRKFRVNLQTRIGGMIIGDNLLILGRAVEKTNAFTGDFGLEFLMRPVKWFSVGVLGYAGFFAFPGSYEGSYGIITGVDGTMGFYF